MEHYLQPHLNSRKITGLIENRTTYTSTHAELNIFETFEKTSDIQLRFPYPIIVAMISGKKRMKLPKTDFFAFLPGETVIVPAKDSLFIDFPDASMKKPTQCLTLGMAPELINSTLMKHNERWAKEKDEIKWDINSLPTHIKNNIHIQNLLQRMVYTFTSDTLFKDSLLEIMLQELILRLIQADFKENNVIYIEGKMQKNRMRKVLNYIHSHLEETNISVNKLADLACMSPSHFYKIFKNTVGVSPVDYINKKRIELAKRLLLNPIHQKISTVAYLSGFNNVAYFNRIFKKYTSLTPTEFSKRFHK